jgi:adenosylcobinamide-GDP ribazoletransferase
VDRRPGGARNHPAAARATDGAVSILGGALVAFRYLTILPLPRSRAPGDLGRAAGWFPVVGLVLGACLALASLGVDRLVPPGVGAILLVALWAALTGGLHLDGLADTCDGLGGGWSRERALSIMRDARSGPYGVTAIVLVLGLKAAALGSLPEGLAWRALLLAPVLGRAGPLLLARLCPPARPDGAGHAFSAGARWPTLIVGGFVALLVSVATLGAWGTLVFGGSGLLAWGLAGHLRRRLGGFTGDTLGALVEATEAGVLTFAVSLDFLELA